MRKIKIAHLADIHIRGLQRHGEMKVVFDAFCKDALEQKADYIFIAGDIFHTKTMGITPEYIDFMTQMLRQLATVAPVHLMLGNHDMNCVNLTRQDAISPIVNAINDPRIKLFKHSGVYEFHEGINWCIFSLFDENRWDVVKPVEGKYNIACFHGSVRGALLESDWEMTEGITVDFFEKYDLAMLGDIHRHQFLGTRVYDGKKVPWIGYPGSMAQQNFAEALEHGYLVWDIDIEAKKHSVDFRKLPNPNPFVTVDWQGNVGKTIKELNEFPEGSRFRIKSGIAITQKDVAQLIADLKLKKSASEIAFKIEESIDRDTLRAGSLTVARDDLRNLEVIMELMREYYENEDIADSEWEVIERQVESYLRAVQLEDAKNVKWSLKKLEWDNTFVYGENNVLNFEKLSGITGIFAPNRMGKSSILGTLLYVLFNGTDRGSVKNLFVINNRKDYCKAKATISVNGTDYLLERQTVKMENKRGPFGVTGLNVFKLHPDGTKEELNGEQRFDTDKVIKGLIGSSDDFLITSVSTQDNLKRYINEGATHRKQIVSRFLDLDIFERIYDVANKGAANTRALHKAMIVRDWDDEVESCRAEIKRLSAEHLNVDKAIPKLQKELLSVEKELKELSEIKPVTPEQLKAQRNVVSSTESKIVSLGSSVDTTKQALEVQQAKLAKIVSICEQIDIDALREKKAAFDELCRTKQAKSYSLKEERSKLDQMEKSVKKLTTVPCGDQFPTCPFIKDSHENKLTIEAQRETVNGLQALIDSLTQQLEELDFSEDKIVNYEKALSAQVKLQSEINTLTMKLVTLERDTTQARESLAKARQDLVDVEKAFENEKNQKVMIVQGRQKELKDQVRSLEGDRNRALQTIGRQESLIEQYTSDKEKYVQLDHELRIHELVANAFSKRGVPNHVIHSQLPLINNEIAKLLHGIVNFTIELESDVETNSLDVYINYGDFRRIIELGSGMEKVIASLALRVALTIITTLPKSDMFVVDEGFSDLDPAGVELCNRLIQSFTRYFKSIIIITHIDGIKDVVDNMIEITREEHDSKVQFE
jgi:DNA repair exonuclease SbcCD ATPase subunit/DNA repair exonuclease SbcCD nuclease subunit